MIKYCIFNKYLLRNSLYAFGFQNMSSNCLNSSSSDHTKMHLNSTEQFQKNLFERLDNIEKSPQDTREYRGLYLQNGMKVLLISDINTDLSAAALSVQVGHMSDPDYLPGLAHFCEHMLFLGTEKYPDENGYTTYLSQNGGTSNAATYSLMTKYHFNVAPDKLDGALDRFAQFFIAPLFTPSATEREINAVNSEYEKNLTSDLWRVKQVHHHLAKHSHPYSKFGSGNKSTLCDIPKSKNINVRDELLNFHKKWYSANIMYLSVIGKESLNELEEMVVGKFLEIENKNVDIPVWSRQPYDEDKYGLKVMILPIKDVRSLTISFTTDDLTKFYKSAPDSYLTHLIGHEGKGSLLAELRQLGWCNDLLAGCQNILNAFGFFDIVANLTQEGMNHIDDIINIIFQYIQLLRQEEPKKWIFDECCDINEMRFRFKDNEQPDTLVQNVVTTMQVYPLEQVLSAPYLTKEWRPDLITNLLTELVPSKCRIILVSQSFEEATTEIEPYFKTKYGTEQVNTETIKGWENCLLNNNLSLPLPNAFIPTNFDIAPLDTDISKHPIIILDTPIVRVWHKQDDQYLKPKACMAFDFSNPIAYLDPLNCNLNQLMVELLKDQLNEYLYDAVLAGLKLQLTPKSTGIDFSIRGYNDKQVVLLEKLLDHLFDFRVNEKRFEIIKEEYTRTLKNFKAEQPFQHSIYYLALILTENAWSNNELLDAVELVTLERVLNYAKKFFDRLHTECFIYGNVTKQHASVVAAIVNKKLESTNSKLLPLLARQMLKKREYKLFNGDSYLFENDHKYHKCSCVQLYFQCGAQSDKMNIMVNLVSQILSEPCYDCLRTKEQLGYIVLSSNRKVNGAVGLRIIVQSTKHPSFVEDRIENFLDNFLKSIEEISVEEFDRHKDALAVKKLEKPKTIFQQYKKFLNEIALAQYHFERDETEVVILRKICKEEFVQFFKNCISRNGIERRVLSVHIISQQFGVDVENDEDKLITNMDHHTLITDLAQFKSSKELFSIALPYLDIKAKGARSKL